MLNAMQDSGSHESHNYIFWKPRDKKFIFQDKATKEKTDTEVGTVLSFDTSTLQTGWKQGIGADAVYRNDELPGVEIPAPDESDKWKRFYNVVVEVNGERRLLCGEGVVNYNMMASLLKNVIKIAKVSRDAIVNNGMNNVVPSFKVTYDGVKEFASKAGTLGEPVFKDLLVDTAPTQSEQASKGAELESDDIPF